MEFFKPSWLQGAHPIPEKHLKMFHIERDLRGGRRRFGIVPLSLVALSVQLIPDFGEYAKEDVNCDNSLEIYDHFFLNNFSDDLSFMIIC